jgi:hypothetical protein
MPDAAGIAIVLLLFLAAAIERVIEVALSPLEGWSRDGRRAVAVAAALICGLTIAFGLRLDLVSPLIGQEVLTPTQGRGVTAIALAGGSGPVHELIRLVEEMKRSRAQAAAKMNPGGE